jgi:iron complex transport system ATP-binding protein
MRIPINGTEARVIGETLVVSSELPLKILSSDVNSGGFSHAKYIINHHVELDYDHNDPVADIERVLENLGIREKAVGMLTAVRMENVAVETNGPATAVVTGGVTNAIASGEESTEGGTINIILLIDANLSEAAMVNAVINATEAKTIALRDLEIKSKRSGELATGTSTDTIAIACTGNGDRLRFAGASTDIGKHIGLATRKAVRDAIAKQEKS